MSMQSSDRLRLRVNPSNVAVPQGYRDIYIDADGNLVKETPGGDKEAVGSGNSIITRTAAQGSPSSPTKLIISSADSDPDVDGRELLYAGVHGGQVFWTADGEYPPASGGLRAKFESNAFFEIKLEGDSGYWADFSVGATLTGSEELVSFSGNAGTLTVVETATPVTSAALGQQCIVGGSVPLIFEACNASDLTEWQLIGPAGVVEDNENPNTYRKLIFDGGATSSEAYTPAD